MARQILFLLLSVELVYAGAIKDHLCTNTNSNSCGSGTPKCPSSASCLSLFWTDSPPYSYTKNNELHGIIPALIATLLGHCCSNCWKVNVTEPAGTQSIYNSEFKNKSNLVFPFYLEQGPKEYSGMGFVSLVKDPSVAYITKKSGTGGIPIKLLSAIWNAWPVLIIALLMSLLAGVLLWFLELWNNREEFPASFFKGSWEGFWWAFVSMTTVGYGDRAPKSILGRGFAIFWILIGICICSIFTATLTTALTTISLEEVKKLSRAKVGAIRNSLEAITGVANQAKVVHFNTSSELWNALSSDQVEGILLDSHLSATYTISKKIEDEDLKVSETVTSTGWTYGILVNDNGLSDCMRDAFESHGVNSVSKLIAAEIEGEEAAENEATVRSSSIFDPTGDLFWPSLYTCIAFTIVMIACGLVWEFFLMSKCKLGKKTKPASTGNFQNLDNLEKEMLAEVRRLFATWRVKMTENAGPVEVVELH